MKLWILLVLYILNSFMGTVFSQNNLKELIHKNHIVVNSDSLLVIHQNAKKQFLQNKDTLKAIHTIIKLSKIHATNGNYSQSYDGYWEALIYSNDISNSVYLDKIYTGLGLLYSVFRRNKTAEKYLNLSLSLQKNRSSNTNIKNQYDALINTYRLFASHHRENGNYGIAQKYLDSCRSVYQKTYKNQTSPFTDAQQAYIFYHLGKFDQALDILLKIEDHFIKNTPAYLVMFYSFLGDIYFKKNDFTTSEKYYLKSLQFSKTYKSHLNYIPNVYQKISTLYVQMKQMDLAYDYLQKSKKLTEQLFGARSNRNILEIKDTYRLEREHQKKIIEQIKYNELQQKQQNLLLRNLILSILIASLTIILGLSLWHFYNKRKSEKLFFSNKQKLSEEKNSEILEFKNKELTSSSLQLIQKDELILEIKEKIISLKNSDKKIINQILAKIKVNKNQDWEEFNARFTSVNASFYNKLSHQYPSLTAKDHRLSALIKLNFSSKEISQLLGISMESVNTSRYRLRKKMGLNKADNLTEVLSRL